ncbi:class I SAM-dependent methyltransferase, partial [Candidatus Woesearchaeota archaeon]|nr:class I SAM-dependent methyltransferase [Candidatus Woesearchaeota archaeon]
MVFQDLNCTRLGRYAGGEIRDTTSSHPIIQFLINPYYEGRLNLEFEHKDDCYCAKIPKKAKPKPSRISEICGNNIRVLDVGCSSGANLLLLEDLLSRAADKKVEVKGYDNDEKIIANAKRRRVCYHTRQALLHPIVKELVDRNYEYIDLNGDEKSAFFALKPEALPRLQSKVFLGDARELPEKDNSADISICLYVLRHNHAEDQWK